MSACASVQQLRLSLRVTVADIARLCGVPVRTAERWVSGQCRTPESALRLLTLAENEHNRDWIEDLARGSGWDAEVGDVLGFDG